MPSSGPSLIFPGLLAREAREAGNPLATYARMVELADEYRRSPQAPIYPEVRANYEEFFGVPFAGVGAMSLPAFAASPGRGAAAIGDAFEPKDALSVIVGAAAKTRIVIFGEEHHLPQTRSLYEGMLRALWQQGYRYLAAETFSEEIARTELSAPDYHSGYYTMDPVFATAVRVGRALGYRLIPYEVTERNSRNEPGERDRKQAENLRARIFGSDAGAKALVLCGRGHAAEVAAQDGWRPMASVLAELTGIDPFTIFAPTMSQRADPETEHPLYRDATRRGLVPRPTIFVDRASGKCLGSGNFDAYVFWPRIQLIEGREDWLVRDLGRKPVPVPNELRAGTGLRLVQAFGDGEPPTVVPVDQILLKDGSSVPSLMLPAGSFWLRSVDPAGAVRGPLRVKL